MIVLGVDPSAKKIAVVAYAPILNSVHVHSYVLYKGKDTQTPAALGNAVSAMRQLCDWVDRVAPTGERYAWVEDPLIGRGGPVTTMKQAYVGGIIRGLLVEAGFTVENVNVSTWKKDVVGHGHAEKHQVRSAVRMTWPKVEGLIGDDGDLADAAAINLYGQQRLVAADATEDTRPPERRLLEPRPRTLVRPARL